MRTIRGLQEEFYTEHSRWAARLSKLQEKTSATLDELRTSILSEHRQRQGELAPKPPVLRPPNSPHRIFFVSINQSEIRWRKCHGFKGHGLCNEILHCFASGSWLAHVSYIRLLNRTFGQICLLVFSTGLGLIGIGIV
jgi:hypothetical protein